MRPISEARLGMSEEGSGERRRDAGADPAARYRRDGVLFPLRALPGEEIAECLRRLESVERARAGRLPPSLSLKPHLLIPGLWDLVHDPRILGPVEALLGPDLLCWASSFFSKAPGQPQHVPWHQDASYWGLDRPIALTAWVAFTPSSPENGCLRIVPGSQHTLLPHGDSRDPANMLFGRETVLARVDEERAVDVILSPGEMSLHHPLLLHGSRANRSGQRRIGFAIRYIAGDLRQIGDMRGSATLVRGRDHGHFDLERQPEGEFHPAALERHRVLLRRFVSLIRREIARHGGENAGRNEAWTSCAR